MNQEQDFIITLILSVGVISFIEMIMNKMFIESVFTAGITVIKDTIRFEKKVLKVPFDEVITMNNGKFKFMDQSRVFFRSIDPLISLSFKTPIPFKVIAELAYDNTIKYEAKIPISPLLFIVAFILFASYSMQNIETVFSVLPIILSIIGIVYFISYKVEKRRLKYLLDELVYLVENEDQ